MAPASLLACILSEAQPLPGHTVLTLQVQKSWMYLEPIFSAQDIQKQLPAEHKAFDQVHRQLREIMRRTKDRPNALQITSNAGNLAGSSAPVQHAEPLGKSDGAASS